MIRLPDLNRLTHAEKDAPILAFWAQVRELHAADTELSKRVTKLEAKLGEPEMMPNNSSVPPSKGRTNMGS